MYVVEFNLDGGDLGGLEGYAVATVVETEGRYLDIDIKKIMVKWPMSKEIKTDVNVTHMVREIVKIDIRDQIENEWAVAKAQGFNQDYDREGA